MNINTNISFGYVTLLKTFFEANDLTVSCLERFEEKDDVMPPMNTNFATKEATISSALVTSARILTTLVFVDNSETAEKITFMSFRHLGLENMLCDYLIRCGIPLSHISIGTYNVKRGPAELEKQWQEHRQTIGLGR